MQAGIIIGNTAEKHCLSPDDVVYLAGPMTGKVLWNYPAFFGFAGLIEKEFGCRVLNPARQPNGLSYETYIDLALADVRKADKVIFLNGWKKSKGARLERDCCLRHNIPMYTQRHLVQLLETKLKGA